MHGLICFFQLGPLSSAWSNLTHPLRPSLNVISSAEPLPSLLPCPLPESLLFSPCCRSILFIPLEYSRSLLPPVIQLSVLPAQLRALGRQDWGPCLSHLVSLHRAEWTMCAGSSIYADGVGLNYVSISSFNIRILRSRKIYPIKM